MRKRVPIALLIGAGLLAGCAGLPGGRHRAAVNGIQICYLVNGRGPALLLLHGGGGNALALRRQIRDFGRHFKVIAPDSRGHGCSTDDRDTLSYHLMAEDMVALLDRLHVRSAHVMGWSDGAIVGIDLALHHPDRVRKLVLFGANFRPDGIEPATLAWLRAAWPDDSTDWAQNPGQPHSMDSKLRRLWLTQPGFRPAELAAIRAPTLVAVGDHDFPRLEHTVELARAIPGAQLCVIPGASHGVLHERPALADEIVLQFLRAPMPTAQAPRRP